MWARRLLGVLRCVPGLSSTAGSIHTGYRASTVPRRRTCVLPRTCTYSTAPWDHHTLSAEEENGAEALPEFNIKVLVNLLRQENGKDLCVIRLPPGMKYVEYFVIVGGTSTRHLQALAEYTLKVEMRDEIKAYVEQSCSIENRSVPWEAQHTLYNLIVEPSLDLPSTHQIKVKYKHLKRDVESHVCLEGKDTDDWMCIDFGEIVVHFMLPETRATYELEKLWTLRLHDDQLSQITPETLPSDFTFGLQKKD